MNGIEKSDVALVSTLKNLIAKFTAEMVQCEQQLMRLKSMVSALEELLIEWIVNETPGSPDA